MASTYLNTSLFLVRFDNNETVTQGDIMKLFKKPNSKDLVPATESPAWGNGAIIYAALKR